MADLKERVDRFLDALGLSKAAFCRKIKLDPSTLWKWRNGKLTLSEASLKRIEDFISSFGF